jgi:hypothetical protein
VEESKAVSYCRFLIVKQREQNEFVINELKMQTSEQTG